MMLIKNAVHLDAPVDLVFDADKIVTMTPAGHCDYSQIAEVFDAGGLLLMPALLDAHAHFREPGQEYKEDIDSGLTAAAFGGFGGVMCMANTRPVNDSAAVARMMLDRAAATHPNGPDLYPIAAATMGLAGEILAPLAEMREAGCVAVSNDGKPLANTDITRHIMEYAADLGMPFIDHCEDPWLAKGWQMHEGDLSGSLGLMGQPGAGEAIQAARDIMLALDLGLPAHIAHVSSHWTVEIIAWAKDRGAAITAETCPHYLVLTDESVSGYNTLAKVSPPLRSDRDRESLRKAVKEGIIDILATDHAPHASHEKNDVMQDAPFGMIGLELALPLTMRLVAEGALDEIDVHRLWAKKPAEIFNLPYNDFSPGAPADFILYDPDLTWKIDRESLHSKSVNTPFLGQNMRGKVMGHWHRGNRLF